MENTAKSVASRKKWALLCAALLLVAVVILLLWRPWEPRSLLPLDASKIDAMEITLGVDGENPFTFSLTEEEIRTVTDCVNSFAPEQEEPWTEELQDRLGSGICISFAAGGEPQSLSILAPRSRDTLRMGDTYSWSGSLTDEDSETHFWPIVELCGEHLAETSPEEAPYPGFQLDASQITEAEIHVFGRQQVAPLAGEEIQLAAELFNGFRAYDYFDNRGWDGAGTTYKLYYQVDGEEYVLHFNGDGSVRIDGIMYYSADLDRFQLLIDLYDQKTAYQPLPDS